ncbi:hypothetical protein [Dissulfurispira sp.]|uniref:hypothetical protein n=1 Tax=Dissulfurispira sp. TaxID=2817609 RepID=UPI002FDACC22
MSKVIVEERHQPSASFSNGIQPFSEAKTARLGIHATLGLSKSLQADAFLLEIMMIGRLYE